MPTTEEIAAAASALTVVIAADRAALKGMQAAAAQADHLDALAATIEAEGRVRLGLRGDDVTIAAPAFVTSVVTKMRARATALRDAVVLPAVPATPPE